MEPVMEALIAMDWVGQLNESDAYGSAARYVLLARPEVVTLEPLMQSLLLPRVAATEKLWQNAHWPTITLREVI
jgi:membrane protein